MRLRQRHVDGDRFSLSEQVSDSSPHDRTPFRQSARSRSRLQPTVIQRQITVENTEFGFRLQNPESRRSQIFKQFTTEPCGGLSTDTIAPQRHESLSQTVRSGFERIPGNVRCVTIADLTQRFRDGVGLQQQFHMMLEIQAFRQIPCGEVIRRNSDRIRSRFDLHACDGKSFHRKIIDRRIHTIEHVAQSAGIAKRGHRLGDVRSTRQDNVDRFQIVTLAGPSKAFQIMRGLHADGEVRFELPGKIWPGRNVVIAYERKPPGRRSES